MTSVSGHCCGALDFIVARAHPVLSPFWIRCCLRIEGLPSRVAAPRKKALLVVRPDRTMSTALPSTSRWRTTIRWRFKAAARAVRFLWFGFYPRPGFIRGNLGPARQWGERFPVRVTAFAAETPPAREVLADSRTMKGGGAAGVATLEAAGVEIARSVLAEPHTAILPLMPYLDTLRLGASPWRSVGSRSRSARGSTIGNGGGGDRRASRPDRCQPVGAGSASQRRHRPRRVPVPPFASAVRRAHRTARRAPRDHGEEP